MEARSVQSELDADRSLRFALLAFVAWMVTAVLPRMAAPVSLSLGDVLLLLPPALAVMSVLTPERLRDWLQLVGVPISLILVSALRAPLQTPSSLPWTLMAGVALLAYWLWTLKYVGQKRPVSLQTRSLQRASLLPSPNSPPWRSFALPFVAVLAALVTFVLPPVVASSERRAFVLAMAAAFSVMGAIGGVVPMLRVEKRKADRKEVGRRALIMLLYALACFAILWGYMEYRQI